MRIIQKFQEGKQVNRQPRHFVGHPYLQNEYVFGNPEQTYNSLSKLYDFAKDNSGSDSTSSSGENSQRSLGNGRSIVRDIIYGENWQPNDTIFTELNYGYDKMGHQTNSMNRQAAVIHSNTYGNENNWSLYPASWAKPKVFNGVQFYYDPEEKKYITIEEFKNKYR